MFKYQLNRGHNLGFFRDPPVPLMVMMMAAHVG